MVRFDGIVLEKPALNWGVSGVGPETSPCSASICSEEPTT